MRRGTVNVGRPHEDLSLQARRLRHTAAFVPAFLAVASLLLAPFGTVAAERSVIVTGRSPETTFYGRGWGHGVGMSQYGARGRALAGQSAAEILAHYYSGTTLGSIDPATSVRVLILSGFAATAAKPAALHGRGGPWTIDGIGGTFPADGKLTLAPTKSGATTWALRVYSAAGKRLHSSTVKSTVTVRPAANASLLHLNSKPSSYDTYRGILRIHLTTTVRVVNELALDTYLRGVVPVEMPASWPAEALNSQAIAARSYAARRLRPGVATYDVTDDTNSQVYRGREGEATTTNAAIAATSGLILKSGSSIANTLYHSTAGGATENNENVFVSAAGNIVAGPVSYLRGSPDLSPEGTPYDSAAPLAKWKTRAYTNDELSAIFAGDARTSVGSDIRLDLSRRGVSRRLISVRLVGSTGTKTVSGDVFRAVFNARNPTGDPDIRSTLFATAPIR